MDWRPTACGGGDFASTQANHSVNRVKQVRVRVVRSFHRVYIDTCTATFNIVIVPTLHMALGLVACALAPANGAYASASAARRHRDATSNLISRRRVPSTGGWHVGGEHTGGYYTYTGVSTTGKRSVCVPAATAASAADTSTKINDSVSDLPSQQDGIDGAGAKIGSLTKAIVDRLGTDDGYGSAEAVLEVILEWASVTKGMELYEAGGDSPILTLFCQT